MFDIVIDNKDSGAMHEFAISSTRSNVTTAHGVIFWLSIVKKYTVK